MYRLMNLCYWHTDQNNRGQSETLLLTSFSKESHRFDFSRHRRTLPGSVFPLAGSQHMCPFVSDLFTSLCFVRLIMLHVAAYLCTHCCVAFHYMTLPPFIHSTPNGNLGHSQFRAVIYISCVCLWSFDPLVTTCMDFYLE